jgi:hypothetical protein
MSRVIAAVLLSILVSSVSFAASFDKLESKFLKKLRQADISPKVTMADNGRKMYTTELSILAIEKYPSTKKAAATIIPADSAATNLNSVLLVSTYIECVLGTRSATDRFQKAVISTTRSHRKESFTTNGYKIEIEPPNSDLANLIVIYITQL